MHTSRGLEERVRRFPTAIARALYRRQKIESTLFPARSGRFFPRCHAATLPVRDGPKLAASKKRNSAAAGGGVGLERPQLPRVAQATREQRIAAARPERGDGQLGVRR